MYNVKYGHNKNRRQNKKIKLTYLYARQIAS